MLSITFSTKHGDPLCMTHGGTVFHARLHSRPLFAADQGSNMVTTRSGKRTADNALVQGGVRAAKRAKTSTTNRNNKRKSEAAAEQARPALDGLPNEILAKIWSRDLWLDGEGRLLIDQVRKFRLICKRLEPSARALLFERFYLYPHFFSLRKLKSISENISLARCVKLLIYDTQTGPRSAISA